jgi:Sugar diacid utilization regulator
MHISQRRAQNIVDEVSAVLRQQLNFINADGHILASTNPARIGQFHGGAARIVQDALEELVIFSDEEYPGAKKGYNLPLVIDKEVVGIIGITGEFEEVYKYGQIIKKMTEILLKDNDTQERKKIEDRIRSRFLDDWILSEQSATDPAFIKRAITQKIDITLPRRVVLMCIKDIEKYQDHVQGQQVIDDVNRCVRRILSSMTNAIFSKTASTIICLISACDNCGVLSFVEKVSNIVQQDHKVTLVAGTDSEEDDGTLSVHQAYKKAQKALHACLIAENKQVFFYDELTYELFLEEISEHSKEQFVRRVFNDYTEKEICEFAEILKTLYENDGSISKTAEIHFIHKNTLQYKLNRLTERTGYNPRAYQAIPLFQLALVFASYKDLADNG